MNIDDLNEPTPGEADAHPGPEGPRRSDGRRRVVLAAVAAVLAASLLTAALLTVHTGHRKPAAKTGGLSGSVTSSALSSTMPSTSNLSVTASSPTAAPPASTGSTGSTAATASTRASAGTSTARHSGPAAGQSSHLAPGQVSTVHSPPAPAPTSPAAPVNPCPGYSQCTPYLLAWSPLAAINSARAANGWAPVTGQEGAPASACALGSACNRTGLQWAGVSCSGDDISSAGSQYDKSVTWAKAARPDAGFPNACKEAIAFNSFS